MREMICAMAERKREILRETMTLLDRVVRAQATYEDTLVEPQFDDIACGDTSTDRPADD